MATEPMRKRFNLRGCVWLVCLVVLSSCSGDDAGDPAAAGRAGEVDMNMGGRGKSIACVACHGAEGVSDHDVWPNLAGQSAEYLAKQMRDFRDGRRGDPWMSPMAGPLSDQDIDDLADYFSVAAPRSGGAVTDGPAVAEQIQTCAACHATESLAGNDNPLWPNLAGQNVRYLIKQLRDFRDGRRADPVMAPLAAPLSDQDIEALAVFYASL